MPKDTPDITPASAEFEAAMLGSLESVMRYARSLTRDASDADDLVQETYLRAFRAWKTFDMTSDPRRWLFAICRHAFLRNRQRESRIVSVDEDLELDALAAVQLHKTARDEGLNQLFDRVDLKPAVAKALAALSDDHRMIVVMVDIDGLGYAEAAEELGLPIGTVRSRLFRARRLLQQSLIEFAKDAGFAVTAQPSAHSPQELPA
ncbi:MAG: RNA polymerase sigma factor [Gemmatimonadaceae bacterium]